MSSRIEYRGEAASLLSRGAATVCSPGRQPGEDVVFEVKPRRGERSDERSECKPDAKRKRDSAQPQDRAQPVRDERSECKPDAKRKRDSAQPQERAQPLRDGICRTYGAHARKARNPRAYARGYILSPLRGFNRMRFARHFGQCLCLI